MKTGKGRSLTMLCADKSVYHAQTHTFTIAPEYEEWETKDTKGPGYDCLLYTSPSPRDTR